MSLSTRWITCPDARGENVIFLARRTFRLREVPARAPAKIAADWRYALYVNGKEAGSGPVRGSHKRYFYDTPDLAPLLRAGENVVAVEVHSPGRATYNAVPVVPALFLEIEGGPGTDGSWRVRIDPSRRADSPPYTPQIGFSEWRDHRKEPAGWTTGADGDALWLPAEEIGEAPPGGRLLSPRDIPQLDRTRHGPARLASCGTVPDEAAGNGEERLFADRMQAEAHSPDSAAASFEDGALAFFPSRGKGGYAVLDFGREVFGSIHLDVTAPEGTVLDLGYGDALYDGRVKTHSGNYRFADRHVLRGGRQRIGQLLHDRGFRYLQIVARRFGEPVRLHAVEVGDRTYPLPASPLAAFSCDDPFLNRLWEMSVATLAACATDTFVDCPWREQSFWICDTLVAFPYYLGLTGEGALPARCLRLAADGQRANGLIPSVYPAAEGRHTAFPSTSAIWTLMLAEYHLRTGDTLLVRELAPALDRALGVYASWAEPDGLVPNQPDLWNFIEWGSPGSRLDRNAPGATSVLNVLVAAAYQAAARLYLAVGEEAKGRAAEERRRQLMATVLRRFWNPDRNRFDDFIDPPGGVRSASQHPHAVGLHYGLLPATHVAGALEALTDPASARSDFYYHYFVLSALADGGRGAEALAAIRELWGEMVAEGSPTVWETRRGKEEFDGVGSLCHAFACAPLHFMQATLLGVRPIEPGFALFSLSPQALGLRHCRGTVPTPHGPIAVSWKRQEDGRLRVEADVPAATSALLPDGTRLGSGRHAFPL